MPVRRRLRPRHSTGLRKLWVELPSASMSAYRRILLVVDLTEHSSAVGRRAAAIAAASGAEVELLHVVEFVPVEPMGETLMPAVEIEQELLQKASDRLNALAA